MRDLIDVDVSPATGGQIDDLQHGRLALVLLDVPVLPVEEFTAARLEIGAGGGQDDLAIDEQIHAGLALVTASTDQEFDVVPLNGKFWRSQLARGLVSAEERVDQSFAFEAGYMHLASERSLGRALPNASPSTVQSP